MKLMYIYSDSELSAMLRFHVGETNSDYTRLVTASNFKFDKMISQNIQSRTSFKCDENYHFNETPQIPSLACVTDTLR